MRFSLRPPARAGSLDATGHRAQGRGAKRETGRQKEDTRSILPRPMRGHRQTRGERVVCTLKVAAGSVLTPVAAPVPRAPGGGESHGLPAASGRPDPLGVGHLLTGAHGA